MTKSIDNTLTLDPATVNTNGNGSHPLVPTTELAIAGKITKEQRQEEEKALQKVETSVEHKYHGLRGYLRIFEVSRVIAMLSLYLYLDQFELHRAHDVKHKRERLEKAERLTRLAVWGEKLYAIRLWFFHLFVSTLRRVMLGSED